MKIEGPQFFGYDKQHIQVIRQLRPETIKPNIFKNVNEDVAMALLLSDVITLSPEAQAILKKLKEKMDETGEGLSKIFDDEEFMKNFQKLKSMVGKKDRAIKEHKEPAHKIEIQIGKGEREKTKSTFSYTPLREKIDKMIVYSPNDASKKIILQELEVLGDNIISASKKFGVRIIILKENEAITDLKIAGMSVVGKGEKTFDGRNWEHVRGIYDQERRLIVLGEEQLGYRNRSTARHEFAHAFDHTFTTKNQRKLPLSVQLWNLFGRERKELVTEYAATNPAEYFAECVEEFFNPSGDQKLKEKDPQMHDYLKNLFMAEAAD